MVLNFVLPTIMVLEGTMLAVQIYGFSYNKHHLYARIDEIYLGASSTYFVINIAWMLHFKRNQQYTLLSRLTRGIQGFLMIALGSLMVQSAEVIKTKKNYCATYEIIYKVECQRYEAKMIAGLLGLIVSIFYLFPPVKPIVLPTSHIEVQTSYTSNNNNKDDDHREKFKNMFFIGTPPSPTRPHNHFQSPAKLDNRQKSLEILNASDLYQYQIQQQQQPQQHTQHDSIISIGGTHNNIIPRAHHKHCPRVHFNHLTNHGTLL